MATIEGLTYKRNYIFERQAMKLLQEIDKAEWSNELKRRVQHYGYHYNYKERSVTEADYLGPLPLWAERLGACMVDDAYLLEQPNQVIVNEYMPGQGIHNHVDCEPCFGNEIASISLGGPVVMEFANLYDPAHEIGAVKRVLLEPASLLVITGPARFFWQHGIRKVKTDTWKGKDFERQRRVSITFRTVLDPFYQVDDFLAFEMRAKGAHVYESKS